jgi:hypothetical protein
MIPVTISMPISVPIPIPIPSPFPASVLVKVSVFPMLGTFDVKATAVPNIGLTDSRPIV